MFEALLDRLVQRVTGAYGGEIEAARKAYFQRCGEPFQDEPSYELRLRNFLEWYIFDWPLAVGLTPYEAYMADAAQPADDKRDFLPFRDQNHSLFAVKGVAPGKLELLDLWTGKSGEVEAEVTAGYDAGAVVEARLVDAGGKTYATQTHVYHNPGSAKFIRKTADFLRARRRVDAWRPFVYRVNYLQLKTERYKHVDSNAIYRELATELKTLIQETDRAA